MQQAATNGERQEGNDFIEGFNDQGSNKDNSEWRYYEL